MEIDEKEFLEHYGTPRHSGRYPWGSGGEETVGSKRNPSFLDTVAELKREGMSDVEVCVALGIGKVDRSGVFKPSTTRLRALKSIAKSDQKAEDIAHAQRLKDKGLSNPAIGKIMGKNESSVRALLADGASEKADALTETANMLERQVKEKTYLDVGVGTELYVGPGPGISQTRLNTAVTVLKEKGYQVHTVPVPQIGTGKDTNVKVLCPPGTTWGDVRRHTAEIKPITEFSSDGGHKYDAIKPPLAINPKRVQIRYKEDGGDQADGVIYVREGVPDLSLGGNRYGQVRIQVGDKKYLKGMAMYHPDIPDGVDLVFNTNKERKEGFDKTLKDLTDDPDLPFGSVIRQILDRPGYPDAKPISAMNLVNEQGKWDEWSKNLSSQFLSKQAPPFARVQLDTAYTRRKAEFDDIMALTNPTVRKKLLEEFAEGSNSAAVHLKAAHLPRQATKVILPLNSLPVNEVYAPSFRSGERVALVRFPHGGIFEIPDLIVNNKNPEGRRLLGDAPDAIGIHHKVAERLSGADFDGDTVLVLPNNSNKIKISPALQQLKDFNPKREFPGYEGMKVMSKERKGIEMGLISNLITDMTIKGASHAELARAVKHSMVVIDAEKHELNYRLSAQVNGIASLKAEYQSGPRGGAATLISRKKSYDHVPERKPRPMSEGGPIDPTTGRRVYVETGKTKFNPITGERELLKKKVNKLDATDDAHTLSSGIYMERIYADHSNQLKGLANQARLASKNTPRLVQSKSAKQIHAREVASIDAKLYLAEKNAPRERQAQIVANAAVKAKKASTPGLEKDTIKKLKFQELAIARSRLGAGKERVALTQEEWDAVQAGAITNNKLERILANGDMDNIRKLATPRAALLMTTAKTTQAKRLLASGLTRQEVADKLGVSLTTLDVSVKGGEDNG